jgi:hypothetical protein
LVDHLLPISLDDPFALLSRDRLFLEQLVLLETMVDPLPFRFHQHFLRLL